MQQYDEPCARTRYSGYEQECTEYSCGVLWVLSWGTDLFVIAAARRGLRTDGNCEYSQRVLGALASGRVWGTLSTHLALEHGGLGREALEEQLLDEPALLAGVDNLRARGRMGCSGVLTVPTPRSGGGEYPYGRAGGRIVLFDFNLIAVKRSVGFSAAECVGPQSRGILGY